MKRINLKKKNHYFVALSILLILAYELWFKQILFEMDIVGKLLVTNLWVSIFKNLDTIGFQLNIIGHCSYLLKTICLFC